MSCEHLFRRRSWKRWQCDNCGLTTRKYDAVDRMGLRPIHRHMSVAYPGFNTTKG